MLPKVLTYTYLNNFIFRSNGLIVGGLDRGFISVYDATKILDGKGDNALVFNKDKHTGQVCVSIVIRREAKSLYIPGSMVPRLILFTYFRFQH